MTPHNPKIALALEPTAQKFARIPLINLLSKFEVFDTLLEAKQLVLDLAEIAPQVVWVASTQKEAFELGLCDLGIAAKVVSEVEADRIRLANKPLRGTIDLQIRSRGGLSEDMVKQLKADKLISGVRNGKDASGIYHWKDDRWYEDYHLIIFRNEDIPAIEKTLNHYGYILAPTDAPK